MTRSRLPFLFLLALLFAVPAQAGDWPHWRGPHRNGHVDEDSGWDRGAWPPKKVLWRGNTGIGSSSPIVVAGKAYVLGWKGGRDHLACLDAADGTTLWSVDYAAPLYGRHKTGDEGMYSGPSSTPEFDRAAGFLYTLGTDGDLICWDTAKKGAKVWDLNLYERYGIGRRPKVGRAGLRDYGYTSAPLVHKDLLLVEVGDPKTGNLIAFDKRTGKQMWASECKDYAGHNGGPAPITVEGVPCVAVHTLHNLVVIGLEGKHQGRTIASYPWETDYGNNIAGPTVHEDCVLITSSYNHKAICKLRITLAGAKKVWQSPYSSSVCCPVVHDGHVYWSWRWVRCLDLADGKQQWMGGIFGDPGSCIVTKDGRLIVWGQRGRLALVETAARSPKQYRELAKVDNVFQNYAWPHVVLADGRLFCKDRNGAMIVWSLR